MASCIRGGGGFHDVAVVKFNFLCRLMATTRQICLVVAISLFMFTQFVHILNLSSMTPQEFINKYWSTTDYMAIPSALNDLANRIFIDGAKPTEEDWQIATYCLLPTIKDNSTKNGIINELTGVQNLLSMLKTGQVLDEDIFDAYFKASLSTGGYYFLNEFGYNSNQRFEDIAPTLKQLYANGVKPTNASLFKKLFTGTQMYPAYTGFNIEATVTTTQATSGGETGTVISVEFLADKDSILYAEQMRRYQMQSPGNPENENLARSAGGLGFSPYTGRWSRTSMNAMRFQPNNGISMNMPVNVAFSPRISGQIQMDNSINVSRVVASLRIIDANNGVTELPSGDVQFTKTANMLSFDSTFEWQVGYTNRPTVIFQPNGWVAHNALDYTNIISMGSVIFNLHIQ